MGQQKGGAWTGTPGGLQSHALSTVPKPYCGQSPDNRDSLCPLPHGRAGSEHLVQGEKPDSREPLSDCWKKVLGQVVSEFNPNVACLYHILLARHGAHMHAHTRARTHTCTHTRAKGGRPSVSDHPRLCIPLPAHSVWLETCSG